jgi:hypothetical protein
MNNLVPNEIVSERGKTDSVFRLRFLWMTDNGWN